jgi:hypothetical protein
MSSSAKQEHTSAKVIARASFPGRITLDEDWYMGPGGKELVAFGHKPADHDQSAFQGIHALSPPGAALEPRRRASVAEQWARVPAFSSLSWRRASRSPT